MSMPNTDNKTTMSSPTIKRIIPAVQQYPWGKKGRQSAVARLLPEFSPESPYAELWVGSHPSAPSRIDSATGQSLGEFIGTAPHCCLGEQVLGQFGELPFLLKILSVAEPLSIQAHPDRIRAIQLHQSSPQHYPDSNHKPEVGVALTTAHLLFGLKERHRILETFARYPGLLQLVPPELGAELKGVSRALSESALRRATYRALITAPASERVRVVRDVCTNLFTYPPTSLFETLLPSLVQTYGPEDIGLLSGLLLDEVALSPGQAIFIGPGVPHAYLSGDLIECMAASDNVVRAGLTRKHQDIETLLEMLSDEVTTGGIIEPRLLPGTARIRQYETPTTEFSLSVIDDASRPFSYQTGGKPEVLLILEGTILVSERDAPPLSLRAGDAAFVPAALPQYQMVPHDCSFVRVTIPNL